LPENRDSQFVRHCPLLAQSGHARLAQSMFAFGGKADIDGKVLRCSACGPGLTLAAVVVVVVVEAAGALA
jgi:hypothetical protein